MSVNASPSSHPASRFRAWWIIGIVLLGLVALWTFLPIQSWISEAIQWLRTLGPWGPWLFIALYVAATVFLIPGSALTLGAGALFGLGMGSVYVSIASTLGATSAFLIGRYLARDAVARRMENHAVFQAIDQAVAREGWKIVGLTRLSPILPFTVLNYALSLTRVSLRDYVLASWIGMMPGTVLYVYLGSLAQAGIVHRHRTPVEWMLYAVGLIATLVVTVWLTRLANTALKRHIPPPSSATSKTLQPDAE